MCKPNIHLCVTFAIFSHKFIYKKIYNKKTCIERKTHQGLITKSTYLNNFKANSTNKDDKILIDSFLDTFKFFFSEKLVHLSFDMKN